MSANSSSVRAAPEPKKRAHISTHGLPGCKANSRMPATTIPTRPNTEWWMCSPPAVTMLPTPSLEFPLARLNTRVTRARGNSRLGVGSIVTAGGLHIHHSVFGLVGMVVAGILEFALQPGSPWVEMCALFFGSGAALTLDEFALILHLEDVYWTGEGKFVDDRREYDDDDRAEGSCQEHEDDHGDGGAAEDEGGAHPARHRGQV